MTGACALLLVVVVAVAWPVWRYLHEHSMFTRRAVLAGVTTEDSRVRRWLWAGRIARIAHVLAALAWATALAVLAHGFSAWQWTVLGLDAALLALGSASVARRMARDVRPGLVGLAARRWPLAWGNVALVAIAFLAIGYFTGAPDTRGQAWHAVAEEAFARGRDASACGALAWAVGAAESIEALAWHAAEVLIPSLPNPWLRLAAWIAFLLQAGIVAIAWTRLLLGLHALADREARASSRPFTITVAVVVASLLAAAFALRGAEFPRLGDGARRMVAWADPCRTDPEAERALRADLAQRLQAVRAEEARRSTARAEAAVDALYREVEVGTEAYLDWYFTVVGEYQRLAALATGRFAERMGAELEQRLFGEGFEARLQSVSAALASEAAGRVREAGREMGARIASEVRARPCLANSVSLPRVADVERDAVRASASVSAGAAVGALAARALARRAAAGAATRMASRPAFRGTAALAGRVAAKRAGSGAGAAGVAAAACGPVAPLCALVAAGITWVALDKALVEIDELRLRDDMRREILQAAAEERAALVAALSARQLAAVDAALAEIDAAAGRVFVPAREG